MPLHRCIAAQATAVALAIFASGASAQDIALGGAQTFHAEAPGLAGGGGTASSPSFRIQVKIEGPAVAVKEAASESYRTDAAPALIGAASDPTPIVLGIEMGAAAAQGGELRSIFGRNLTGGGTPELKLGGVPLSQLQFVSDSQVSFITEPTLNSLGNPAGLSPLVLNTPQGAGQRRGAFAPTPALVPDGPAVVGGAFGLSIHAAPGALVMLASGSTVPGVGIPLVGFDGSLELLANLSFVATLVPVPSDGHLQRIQPIPDTPSLAGLEVPLQAVAIDDLVSLGGGFTNTLALPIQ